MCPSPNFHIIQGVEILVPTNILYHSRTEISIQNWKEGLFIMEKNHISAIMQTCFYVNIEAKQYGVIINIKDIERAEEIIQYFKTTRKEQINAWQKEWAGGVA